MPVLLANLLLVGCLAASLAHAAVPPRLVASDELATAGFYHLSWTADLPPGNDFVLEESTTADFTAARVIYRGPDRASLLSGRVDGEYHYRIRVLDAHGTPGVWSAPTRVEVRHHPLGRAGAFFLLGLFVFVALVYAVLRERGVPARRHA